MTISIEQLRENFCYTPTTGVVVHSRFKSGSAKAGQPAGHITDKGRLRTEVRTSAGRRLIYNSRIAWALHYGRWPDCQIDHVDRDRLNNRIENLRDVSSTENKRNNKVRSDSQSGIRGVYQAKNGRWCAQIGVGGMKKHLGTFSIQSEAVDARLSAELVEWV